MVINNKKLLTRLVGVGRGQYQADSIEAQLERGMERYAVDKTLNGFKWPLFADVGTGKTPSTLVYLYYVRKFLASQGDARATKPVLMIVPATVKWNWIAETHRWREDLNITDIFIINGTKAERELQLQYLEIIKPKITVTNYETITAHQQFFQGLGNEFDPFFLAVICDEAHYIKNAKAQRTRAVLSICAEFHGALTGTPMSNKPDSVFNILHWLDNTRPTMRTLRARPAMPNNNCPIPKRQRSRMINHPSGCGVCSNWNPRKETCKRYTKGSRKPFSNPREEMRIRYRTMGQWGTYDSFTRRYCEMEQVEFTKRGRQYRANRIAGPKKSMMSDLHRRLRNFGMIRWRRAEVLQMEKILYEHVTLRPTPEQDSIYTQLQAGFVQLYDEDDTPLGPMEVRSVLAQLTYFRRATTLTSKEFQLSLQGKNPDFAPDLRFKSSDSGAKQEWLLEFIGGQLEQDGNGDKFLIFSDWTSALHPLRKRIAKSLNMDELKWNGRELVPAGLVRNPDAYMAIIDGSTDQYARQKISERWNTDSKFKVFLGSPAAYEGINMQGGLKKGDAAYVILLNLPWLPKDVIQAVGRAWRYGQEGQVIVMIPRIEMTIDERMADELEVKQQAFDQAIDGGYQNMAELFQVKDTRTALQLIG